MPRCMSRTGANSRLPLAHAPPTPGRPRWRRDRCSSGSRGVRSDRARFEPGRTACRPSMRSCRCRTGCRSCRRTPPSARSSPRRARAPLSLRGYPRRASRSTPSLATGAQREPRPGHEAHARAMAANPRAGLDGAQLQTVAATCQLRPCAGAGAGRLARTAPPSTDRRRLRRRTYR